MQPFLFSRPAILRHSAHCKLSNVTGITNYHTSDGAQKDSPLRPKKSLAIAHPHGYTGKGLHIGIGIRTQKSPRTALTKRLVTDLHGLTIRNFTDSCVPGELKSTSRTRTEEHLAAGDKAIQRVK
jgi:hypothetical protein